MAGAKTTAEERPLCYVHILVEGRVQGVGFRNYVLRLALARGLFGWVRNLTDGRVEVLVGGSDEKVDDLIRRLRRGPSSATVTGTAERNVTRAEDFASLELGDFQVRETAERPWGI